MESISNTIQRKTLKNCHANHGRVKTGRPIKKRQMLFKIKVSETQNFYSSEHCRCHFFSNGEYLTISSFITLVTLPSFGEVGQGKYLNSASMQNERGTLCTRKHQLTCKDAVSESLPALCTSCAYFWRRTWSRTWPWRNLLSFWCFRLRVTSFFFFYLCWYGLMHLLLNELKHCLSQCKMRKI